MCQELNIDLPDLYFDNSKLATFESNKFDSSIHKIIIGRQYHDYETLSIMPYDFKVTKLHLLITLLHEFAHYIQYKKYNKWFWKYTDIKLQNINDYNITKEIRISKNHFIRNKLYRTLKIESNANKITWSLLKRFYPEVLTELK